MRERLGIPLSLWAPKQTEETTTNVLRWKGIRRRRAARYRTEKKKNKHKLILPKRVAIESSVTSNIFDVTGYKPTVFVPRRPNVRTHRLSDNFYLLRVVVFKLKKFLVVSNIDSQFTSFFSFLKFISMTRS